MGETMIDVIVDQRFLGGDDRLFDRVKLLSNVDARPAALDHLDNAAQMTARPIEPLDDRGMAVVAVIGHGAPVVLEDFQALYLSPQGG